MSLTYTIASRNLFQDRLRFIATIVGIVFSIILVTIQMGLFLSFDRMVTTMIDHAPADLWIVPFGTKCFEDPSLLNASDRAKALAVQGVREATPVVIGFAQWTVPGGGTTPVFVVGSNMSSGGIRPWHLVQGDIDALSAPHAVATDRTYFGRLGIKGINDTTDIRGQTVQVKAVTQGIRSFTTTPYVFTSLDQGSSYAGIPPDKISYLLVRVTPGADIDGVRQRLLTRLSNVEVLNAADFSSRSRSFWLFGTGAGAALFAGALLGSVVGTVVVAQTLYSSTKDHLNEFATLRAIGSSNGYIHKIILFQALLSAAIGFSAAASLSFMIVLMTANTALPIVMTPAVTLGLFLLTVIMCIASTLAAIAKVTRIDPATVFKP